MRTEYKNKSKFFFDILLNIFASGIVAVILQFLVYPSLNRNATSEIFGEILIMMSVVNIVSGLLGNSLNNIRLIKEKEYNKENINGDFSIILLIAGILNCILMTVIFAIMWSDKSSLECVLLVLISIFQMLRAYLTVSYRLKLDYKKILQHNLIYSVGLVLGTTILLFMDNWQYVFLIGEFVSFLFLVKTTNLIKESLKFTSRFKDTFKQYIYLSLSGLIGNISMYIDRLVIYLFLGTHQVAVFFAATIIGKMSSYALTPISGVFLSYISNKNRKMTLKEFGLINISILIFSFIATIVTLIISKPLLKILYSDLYLETLNILIISNLAAILFASSSITQSIVLKYSATYLQIVIQATYAIIYVFGGILMINQSGLKGFSIAALIAAIVKFIFTLLIGVRTLKDKL